MERGTGRIEATDQVLGLSVSGLEGLFHRELAGLMALRAVALVCRVPKPKFFSLARNGATLTL